MPDIFDLFEDELEPPAPPGTCLQKYMPGYVRRQEAAPYHLQKLAKEYTEEAFIVIMDIMKGSENDPSTRLEAAKQILDRGWGKPSLKVQAETIAYTLQDVERKLLENKQEMDIRVVEARRIESGRLARYITEDAEDITDVAVYGEGTS